MRDRGRKRVLIYLEVCHGCFEEGWPNQGEYILRRKCPFFKEKNIRNVLNRRSRKLRFYNITQNHKSLVDVFIL
jgi:hypothetical protein